MAMAGGGAAMARGLVSSFQALRSARCEDSEVRVPYAPPAGGVFARASDKSPVVVKDASYKELAEDLSTYDPHSPTYQAKLAEAARILSRMKRAGLDSSAFEAMIRQTIKPFEQLKREMVAMDEAKVPESKKKFWEYCREIDRCYEENEFHLRNQLRNRYLSFDPKQDGSYFTRFTAVDLRYFDLDEESPLGPMRFTDGVYKHKGPYELCEAVNIYSVKIVSSDVGFPIHVYGTLIARDQIDYKCIYLFRNDRDHCQIINSEDESLVLTGPKRGLALLDNVYIETDLKIKEPQGQDRELSKGLITIRCIRGGWLVRSMDLETRLSTVDVLYGFVENAVEGTIAVEVTQGEFNGVITAYTGSTDQNRLVIYNSEQTGDGKGVLPLMRPVVCVNLKDDFLIIDAMTHDCKRTISFTPKVNGGKEVALPVGHVMMRVKVNWSLMDP